jgi:hypothetical protein
MDLITPTEMGSLLSRSGPSVSLYMPTQRAGRETRQGPIRLKNLLGEARDRLSELAVRSTDADALLAGADELVSNATFWQHQEDGLAVIIGPEGTDHFRLPAQFEELVVLGDVPHLKPLWPLVSSEDRFYILTLSRNKVRLLWADRFDVGEIDIPDEIPESLAEALWFDDPEKQLQSRAISRVGQGRVVAEFHGHGVPEENDDARLSMFLRAVDRGLHDLIKPEDPIVLAGVDDIVSQFRGVTSHPTMAEDAVAGNADIESAQDLHSAALEVMQPLFTGTREADRSRVLAGGDLVIEDVPGIVEAAVHGRIDAIFVPLWQQHWVEISDDGTTVTRADSMSLTSRDAFDVAASATWSAGGRVHAVVDDELPTGSAAAVLRY